MMPKLIFTFFYTLPLTIAGFFSLILLDVNWQGLELLTRMSASIFGYSASQELESLCNRQRYGEKIHHKCEYTYYWPWQTRTCSSGVLQQKKCEGLAVLTCSGVSMNGLARVIPFFLLI